LLPPEEQKKEENVAANMMQVVADKVKLDLQTQKEV
jgi:hypothetical protein